MDAGAVNAGPTRRAALRRAADRLRAAGIAEAEGDARFLTLGVLGLAPRDLAVDGERTLDPEQDGALDAALARRIAGEPVARILGAWEFWGLPFRLAPETLVPRPDTETLVEAALASVPDRGAAVRILDLGTGSGCVLVALLTELPRAHGFGLDRSAEALRTARANAEANGVSARAAFAAGDWCDPLGAGGEAGGGERGGAAFDLVVSNPPYIARAVIAGLDREVRLHDPVAALDGGPDGLDAYRRILGGSPGILASGGTLAVEIGFDQAEPVRALARAAGYRERGLRLDLGGRDRALSFDRPGGHAVGPSPA